MTIEEFNETLEELSLLTDNWDGEDSYPMQEGVKELCEYIICKTINSIRYLDSIDLSFFGSVIMEWKLKDRIINVEVYKNNVAFYISNKERTELYPPICQSANGYGIDINELIEQINKNQII